MITNAAFLDPVFAPQLRRNYHGAAFSHELVQQYPDKWVGLHHSLGVLHSDTYQGIYQELKDHRFPEAQTAIALLEKNPRIMIL